MNGVVADRRNLQVGIILG